MDPQEKERVRIEGKEHQHNLVQSLLSSDNKTFQDKAIEDLAAMANSTAIELLGRILYDKNASFRKLAARTLREIENNRENIRKEFLEGEEKDAAEVAMAKATLSKIKSLKLLLIQNLADEDQQIRKLTAEALEEFDGKSAVEPFIHLLKDKDRNIREIAAKALGENVEEQHLGKLKAMLKDESNGVRWYVGEVLIEYYKRMSQILPLMSLIFVLIGLFGYFVLPEPGGVIEWVFYRGTAYLMWIVSVCVLFGVANHLLWILRIKGQMKNLDKEK